MGWIDAELALTAIAAMLSPTTLSFSVLALVLGDRPLRTGVWFYLGALVATLAIGVAAAFVLGDKAASATSYPKPWVAVVDIVLAFPWCSSACGSSGGRAIRSVPRAWSTR
jgi:Sap, sulfolipid-1-addressing protein